MVALAVSALLIVVTGCWRGAKPAVVVYTSQDQVYAEPLLQSFAKESGIEIRTVFDSEAVKTVGLVNRLIAERGHPQADVFWNSEELRSHQLAAAGVFSAPGGFVRFGQRSRRLVINTNLLALAQAPRLFSELTNTVWRERVALAYPLFGTTATHFLALRQRWGAGPWLAWCRALAANQPKLVDGNSQVVRMVGRGEAVVGMTDSDDIVAAQREGLPLLALSLNEESLLIPNTAGVVVGAPNPDGAARVLAWLQSDTVINALVKAGALEPAMPGVGGTPMLVPDWPALLRDLDRATGELKEVFLR